MRTATVSSDRCMKIYDFNSKKVTHCVKEESPLISLDWCQTNSNYIVYGSETGDWVLKDIRNIDGDVRRESMGKSVHVRKVGFSSHNDSRYIAIGGDSLNYYKVERH